MSELKKTCGYHGLLRDLAYYATGEWQPEVEQCPQEPTYYVSIKTAAGDFEAELLRNLCAEHRQRVRSEVAGWQWSRPKQVIDDYLRSGL